VTDGTARTGTRAEIGVPTRQDRTPTEAFTRETTTVSTPLQPPARGSAGMKRRLSLALAALLCGSPAAAVGAVIGAAGPGGPGGPGRDSTATRRPSKTPPRASGTVAERLLADGERIREEAAAERAARGARSSRAVKRAGTGEQVAVQITYYCLKGTTRTDNPVREGIVAADPRVFPLRRHVDIHVPGEHLGRYLVDDTGKAIKGNILDIWVPSCAQARRLGRRHGTATLVSKEETMEILKKDPS
jgi:3D (Asp-Asp-Asp) domain-containing protein